MTRVLGINVAGSTAYLALCDDAEITNDKPEKLVAPDGLAADSGTLAFLDDIGRVLGQLRVERVRVLDPEPTYSTSVQSVVPRITIETLFLLAAWQRGLDAGRISRARIRSLLDLGRSGSLSSLAASVTKPVGSSWTGKRDLAALAALAGGRE